ncbi:flagellar protein FlgN [Lysinibacillus sp. SGAir0095]|uniref:flagellar protein FlgN n=1 Tax=Lysinibacillus sp. SGAir0095 TaxID=2070463 RepID=UPI0010CCF46B|nr:flagellar protein FlgN [Lysinibacillus sp. SGAir0095]QCR31491.1 flagellar protein FlgN [Lysinibacillus sp. SGAir0095]
MSVQSIISILERLEKMHKSLLELSFHKTELVKKGDMEGLDTIIKNEQSHVAAIEVLEKQRQQMVTDYLRAKGIALADTPTVADVIEAAESDNERKRLEDIRNELMSVIADLSKQNDLNQKLVFQSLQFVNMSLDMLRPRPEEINYSGKTRSETATPKKSMFDSQA